MAGLTRWTRIVSPELDPDDRARHRAVEGPDRLHVALGDRHLLLLDGQRDVVRRALEDLGRGGVIERVGRRVGIGHHGTGVGRRPTMTVAAGAGRRRASDGDGAGHAGRCMPGHRADERQAAVGHDDVEGDGLAGLRGVCLTAVRRDVVGDGARVLELDRVGARLVDGQLGRLEAEVEGLDLQRAEARSGDRGRRRLRGRGRRRSATCRGRSRSGRSCRGAACRRRSCRWRRRGVRPHGAPTGGAASQQDDRGCGGERVAHHRALHDPDPSFALASGCRRAPGLHANR